jgi:hypothetical protein
MKLLLYVPKKYGIIYFRKHGLRDTTYAFCTYMYHSKQSLTCLALSKCTYLNMFTLDEDQVIGLETNPFLPHG